MVRKVRGTNGTKSPQMVRNVYGTNSLWYEKSGIRTHRLATIHNVTDDDRRRQTDATL